MERHELPYGVYQVRARSRGNVSYLSTQAIGSTKRRQSRGYFVTWVYCHGVNCHGVMLVTCPHLTLLPKNSLARRVLLWQPFHSLRQSSISIHPFITSFPSHSSFSSSTDSLYICKSVANPGLVSPATVRALGCTLSYS